MIAAALGFASCSSDNNGNDDEKLITSFKVVSATNEQVLSEGVYAGTDVTITFSDNITISSASAIKLDGIAITVTPTASGKNLSMRFFLAGETEHELTLGRGAVKSTNGAFIDDAYTYTFTTAKQPEIVNNFEQLSNANATQEAKNVYNFLVQQNGKKIITGAMANVNNNNDFADWVYKQTGKYPALTCYDFIHFHYSGQNWIDYSNITPAQTQWQNNGLVAYMWHWLVPKTQEDYDSKNYSNYTYDGSFDIDAALTEGTWQYDCINNDIAQIAGYLKLLQDKNIPVIWRPLHEAAGDYTWGSWFWWGSMGVEATKRLWIYLHDKLTNEYGLNNLIWVWTAQTSDEGNNASIGKIKAAYPGNDYVDIVGTDIYVDNDSSQKEIYDLLRQLTGGKKLITIAETGLVQNPDKCIADGAAWSYFMIWYTNDIHKSGKTTDEFGNTTASLKEVFNSQFVINRDQMPSLK
jgi:mannan endo-1,4-beta-mannosidase